MNIRPFEVVLIGIFLLLGISGLAYLSMFKGGGSADGQTYGSKVVVWGTFSKSKFDNILLDASATDKALSVVEYVEKDPRTFNGDFVNAIAEGNAPDLVLIPHTLLVTHRSKLRPISFDTIPERTYRDNYIEGAEIFMRSDGIYGIPLAVDPLVMYWNRSHRRPQQSQRPMRILRLPRAQLPLVSMPT
jgi:maltose-binding protein MalE